MAAKVNGQKPSELPFLKEPACNQRVFKFIVIRMELPTEPVTLSVEQVAELHHKLGSLRHDINNCLSLIIAAAEVTQLKPTYFERMMMAVNEQPQRIIDAMTKFSGEFDKTFGIKR